MTKFKYWVSMERMGGKVFGLLILGLIVSLGVFTSGTECSQETGGRATDIKNKLEKISGSDPIERIVALEDLLNTEGQVLRSLAVEKALQTDDRRVREVALGYLVGTQKKFVVEVSIPEKEREEIKKLGLTRPRSQFSRVRVDTRNWRANKALETCSSVGCVLRTINVSCLATTRTRGA